MNFDKIDDDNFLIYATKAYDANQAADIEEFNSDLRRFSSAKRLLLRLTRRESLNIRMLLNHIIILGNLFGVVAIPKLLFSYCPKNTHPHLRTILEYLGLMPDHITETNVNNYSISNSTLNILRGI